MKWRIISHTLLWLAVCGLAALAIYTFKELSRPAPPVDERAVYERGMRDGVACAMLTESDTAAKEQPALWAEIEKACLARGR